MRTLQKAALHFTVLLCSIAHAQPTSRPSTPPEKLGSFHLTLDQRSPLSPIEDQNRRYRLKVEPIHQYDLKDESFEAYIPEDYDPAVRYGLIVWVSSSKSGAPSKGWLPILSRNHLIWIGANVSGNDRGIGARVGLALDAAHNFIQTYSIDESRVYASGVSGGGKISTILGICYPEVFSGAMPIAGVTYYRAIPVSIASNRAWATDFQRPPASAYDRAREQSRFALLTGSNDFNRDSIKDTYNQGLQSDGFKHIDYIEVPGMGHGIPEAEWVEKAIAALDAPLPALAKEQFQRAQQFEKNGRYADALKLYSTAANHLEEPLLSKALVQIEALKRQPSSPAPTITKENPDSTKTTTAKPESDEEVAQKLLSLAESYQRNNLTAQAKQRLEKIVQDHPRTKAAVQAKALLQRMGAGK